MCAIYGINKHYPEQAKKRMTKLIKTIIQEKRKKMMSEGEDLRGGAHPRDMIDVLLGNGNGELTDELISDNMIDFMIPAEDSVPVLITLAVKYLSECPLALQQLEVCLAMMIDVACYTFSVY